MESENVTNGAVGQCERVQRERVRADVPYHPFLFTYLILYINFKMPPYSQIIINNWKMNQHVFNKRKYNKKSSQV